MTPADYLFLFFWPSLTLFFIYWFYKYWVECKEMIWVEDRSLWSEENIGGSLFLLILTSIGVFLTFFFTYLILFDVNCISF